MSREIFKFSGARRTTLTSDQARRTRQAYCAMLSHIDDRVGQILGALKVARLDEDTVMVVMSDHGNMLGERGLWGLRVPFEWGMRVPFVFHCPKRFAPARIATPVSLVDLLPTLVELGTGASAEKLANPVDGASLVGHLNAQDNMGERDVLVEYCSEGFAAPWFMVRRGRYKFVYCENTPPLLFDLETDPEERVDLAADPAHAATVDELRGALLSQWDVAGLPALMTESRQRRATIFEANKCGRAPVWAYAVNNDPYRSYQRNYREAWQKTEERALFR